MEPLLQPFISVTRPLPEPHLLVAGSGTILAANPAAARVLGVTTAQPGISLFDMVKPPADTLRDYLRACSASGSLLPGAIELRTSRGGTARYRCEGAALRGTDIGDDVRIMLRLRPQEQASQRFVTLNDKISDLAREIHNRRQAEEELQAQALQLEETAAELEATIDELERQKLQAEEASRAKSDFLAVMSHELRTPLNAIIGFADLMTVGVDDQPTESQLARLRRIKRAAEHLTVIISQILDFSRMEVGRESVTIEDVDLVELAIGAAELIEPSLQDGTELVLDLPEHEVRINTDEAKVRQILINLLSNAAKFTYGGRVTLSVRTHDEGAELVVADTGIGIAADQLDMIFEPFWQVNQGTTRAAGGTGLGLTVTRGLANLLGGRILVSSELGVGSEFVVRLREAGNRMAENGTAEHRTAEHRTAELEGGREGLLEAVGRVREGLRGVSPGEDGWSVLHVLEHVARVDVMIAGLLRRMLARAEAADSPPGGAPDLARGEAGDTAAAADAALAAILDHSRHTKAVPKSEPIGGMSYDEVERMLSAARAELLDVIAGADGRDLDSTTHPHPLLGPLTIRQWIRFAALHDARHAAQIDEIRTQLEDTGS